ncbi:MAG: SDR family oxidoreductase [Pseudobdellovibrionaceae bacterium]
MKNKVWFITGASSGFGKGVIEQALKAGDSVIAVSRTLSSLEELSQKYKQNLLILKADVRLTDDVDGAVKKGLERFGKIDVLLNNAGHGLFGGSEEVTEDELLNVFETNVFGLMRLIRAVLPTMRSQKSGQIINVSSSVGHATLPFVGAYTATKHAVEAISESLQGEVASFGIRVNVIDPGYYATGFASSMPQAKSIPDYQAIREQVFNSWGSMTPGDPIEVVSAIGYAAENSDAPFRIFVGDDGRGWAKESLTRRLQDANAEPVEKRRNS